MAPPFIRVTGNGGRVSGIASQMIASPKAATVASPAKATLLPKTSLT
jgi:hypothetical protein